MIDIILNLKIFLSIFKIYFLRSVCFYFLIYFEQYSFTHKIYKVIYFTFIILPIISFIFSKNKFNVSFLLFSFGCLSVISIFIILTFIDYDLRYRLYIWPFIIMISNYSFTKLIDNKKII